MNSLFNWIRFNIFLKTMTALKLFKYLGPRKNSMNVVIPGLMFGGTLGTLGWLAVAGVGGLILTGPFLVSIAAIPVIGTGAIVSGIITALVIFAFARKFYREQFEKLQKKSEAKILHSTNSIMAALTNDKVLRKQLQEEVIAKDHEKGCQLDKDFLEATERYVETFNEITKACHRHIIQGYFNKTAGGFGHNNDRFRDILRLQNIENILHKLIQTKEDGQESKEGDKQKLNKSIETSLLILVGYIDYMKTSAEEQHREQKGWFHYLTKSNFALYCEKTLDEIFSYYKQAIDENVDRNAILKIAGTAYTDFRFNNDIDQLFNQGDITNTETLTPVKLTNANAIATCA